MTRVMILREVMNNVFIFHGTERNAGHAIVYQSDDDPYVGLGNGQELAKHLGVELSFVPNAGHFNTKAGYTTFEDLRDKIVGILGRERKADVKQISNSRE